LFWDIGRFIGDFQYPVEEKSMHDCHFALNGDAMSAFEIGSKSFPAFSGLGDKVNQRRAACESGVGPIPPNKYYIVDRKSGGTIGPILDRARGRTEWFALYAADKSIDDKTFCMSVERGNFRLHPKGRQGISQGCITIEHEADFMFIRSLLLCARTQRIPGTDMMAYGTVSVL
jgi:Protein of unknown function (DUF2778)